MDIGDAGNALCNGGIVLKMVVVWDMMLLLLLGYSFSPMVMYAIDLVEMNELREQCAWSAGKQIYANNSRCHGTLLKEATCVNQI